MSSDLLAEFDSFYTAPKKTVPSSTPASNDLLSLSGINQNGADRPSSTSLQWPVTDAAAANDIWANSSTQSTNTRVRHTAQENDIWGSFESLEGQRPISSISSLQKQSTEPPETGANVRGGITRRSTAEIFSGTSKFHESHESDIPWAVTQDRPGPDRRGSSGGEILFDAGDEFEDEDDFGEFETVQPEPKPQVQSTQPLEDLLGDVSLDPKRPGRPSELLTTSVNPNIPLYPIAPKSPSFQERNPFADLKIISSPDQVVPTKTKDELPLSTPVTAWPTFEPKVQASSQYHDSAAPVADLDEEWGDFADLPAETADPASAIEAEPWAWNATDKVAEPSLSSDAAPPPTNIPPPSMLLALLPSLFDLPQSTLFKAVANQPFSLKNRIMSNPSTIDFLRAYLLIATVAARLIAGRKHRWKRDTLLAQSMKIGPAAAGGKGGMKLAGVDKLEVTKEDREVADVVRVWKEQLGRLRSAVAIANSSIKDETHHLIIPEISESMLVKTQPGAMTAPKPCIVCGLKRDERVNKVDLRVEDSFGEWWTEYWGHRACKNFWQEHEKNLKQR